MIKQQLADHRRIKQILKFIPLNGSLANGVAIGKWIYRTITTSENGKQIELEWER